MSALIGFIQPHVSQSPSILIWCKCFIVYAFVSSCFCLCVCRGVFLLSSFTGFVGCVQENSTVLFYLFFIVHLNWVCWLCAGEQHRGVGFYCPPSLGLLAVCRRTARCYFIYFLLSILTGFVDCVQVNSTVLFYLLFIVHLNWVCWLCAGEQHGSVGFYCPPSLGLLAVCRRTAPWCVWTWARTSWRSTGADTSALPWVSSMTSDPATASREVIISGISSISDALGDLWFMYVS